MGIKLKNVAGLNPLHSKIKIMKKYYLHSLKGGILIREEFTNKIAGKLQRANNSNRIVNIKGEIIYECLDFKECKDKALSIFNK